MRRLPGAAGGGQGKTVVVLNQNLFEVAAHQIKSVLPEAVIMDGAIVSRSLEDFAAQ